MKRKVTFLDLPGELRNQIYGHLLPDSPRWQLVNGMSLRRDGQKASTNFMASCRQVHAEAVSLLYGDQAFEVCVSPSGSIEFVGQEAGFEDLETANFSATNQIKVVNFLVRSNLGSACIVQDALFTFMSQLRSNHKLHTLNVKIDVDMPGDGGYALFTSNYAERMFQLELMHELRHLRPGDISRAHLAAFLTDPFRCVRNLRDGKKKGKFTLKFSGCTGKSWRDIQGTVRALVQGNSPVPDYKIFCAYFAQLQTLRGVIDTLRFSIPIYSSAITYLQSARIRGDLGSFVDAHQNLTYEVNTRILEKLNISHLSRQRAQLVESKVREAIYLLQELESALPPQHTDTSFLGYNESEDALREWQDHGRDAEKAAKAKRKREREEAKSAVTKKLKVT